jgi:small subunit ribosomal protein S18
MSYDRRMDQDDDMRDRGGADGDPFGLRRRTGRRKVCRFCADPAIPIDYKDALALRYFISDRGKIVPRRISGTCAYHQRAIALAVKRARNIALMPYTSPVGA